MQTDREDQDAGRAIHKLRTGEGPSLRELADQMDAEGLDSGFVRKRSYLTQLDRTFSFSVVITISTLIIGIFCGVDLVRYADSGVSIIHPWLALFIGMGGVFLLIVAITSAWQTREYLKAVVIEHWEK